MAFLRKTQPYFVRCFKPNHEQIPNHLIDQFVLKQLQYSGMLETVRIRRQGYPVRFAFQDFVDRFQFLPPAEHKLLAQQSKGGCVDVIKYIMERARSSSRTSRRRFSRPGSRRSRRRGCKSSWRRSSGRSARSRSDWRRRGGSGRKRKEGGKKRRAKEAALPRDPCWWRKCWSRASLT